MDRFQELIQILRNSGMGNLIDQVSREGKLAREEQKGEIPIPSTMIQDNKALPIWLDEGVFKEYQNLCHMLNETDTAKEYPFALLGHNTEFDSQKIIFFNKLVYCYCKDHALDTITADFYMPVLSQVLSDKEHDVISIGHTHPMLRDDELGSKITNQLMSSTKERFGIRRPGLNISMQDFYQHYSVQQQTKDKGLKGKELFQCIVQYDGEMVLIHENGGRYEKFADIIGLENGYDKRILTRGYTGEKDVKKERKKEDEYDI